MSIKPNSGTVSVSCRCPKCGLGDIAIKVECQNSACEGYAENKTIYEGWKSDAQPAEQQGEPEVLARIIDRNKGNWSEGGMCVQWLGVQRMVEGVELIDRASIAPLKAEIEQLLGELDDYKASRERLHEWLREAQLRKVHLSAQLAERLGDAYEWGYGEGQNSPNGYSSKEDRDRCVSDLMKKANGDDDAAS